MKPLKLIMLAIIITIYLTPTTSATVDDAVKYSIMPGSGTSTQKILVWVRCDPLIEVGGGYLYIFWDDILIIKQVTPTVTGGHYYGWDTTITPPTTNNYKGKHTILLWIEYPDGTVKTRTWQYTVTDGLPPVEWWKTLPKEFLDQIRGAKGDKGDTGAQGPAGSPGPRGAQGNLGSVGETGATGPQGVQGVQGVPGEPDYGLIVGIVAALNLGIEAVKYGVRKSQKES